MSISIFAKEAFLNINPNEPFRLRTKPLRGGHLQRVSSMIRGDQIADAIGARFNPESGYENDVCIYVKPHVGRGQDFKFEGKKAYLDIIDGHKLGHLALKHSEVGVIVCSKADYEIMKKSIPNELVLIPQHHCNFERELRFTGEIKKIGIIGEESAFVHLPEELEQELTNRGIELVKLSKFFSRQDVIDFYMSIDLQIVWRPYKKILSNPLKIVNAASFGIPTIALDEPAFKEVEGAYIGVQTLEELVSVLDVMIKETKTFKLMSEACVRISEKYHIEKVSKLYKQL